VQPGHHLQLLPLLHQQLQPQPVAVNRLVQ